MGVLRALFAYVVETSLMNCSNVIPPKWLLAIRHKFSVQANLSKVLHDDVLSLDETTGGLVVVGGAVLPVPKALILLEVGLTLGTGPCNELRCELHVISQLVVVLIELLDEVKGEHVVAAVPELNFGVVVWVGECELG
jgi:hypothetical protein